MNTTKYCDGISRRDFLRVGALAGVGMTLSNYLALAEAGEIAPAKGKSAIFIRLAGGPSHLDTFDLKPDAPEEYRGEFKPIATNVAGMQICEHLPKLAQVADKYAILRGVSHTLAAHDLGTVYMNTGNKPIPSLRFPTYGAVVSREISAPPDMPSYVAVPNAGGDATGYLGVEYGPFETDSMVLGATGNNDKGGKKSKGSVNSVTLQDIDRRQNLVNQYDDAFGNFAQEDRLLAGMDQFSQKAYAIMRSSRAREAFDVSKESPAVASLFGGEVNGLKGGKRGGSDGFQQNCLLATRLVEAGVKFVTISTGGWDTHANNFKSLEEQLLPNFDAGLSGLFRALEAKGLLASTTVFVTGEFGRTPKINPRAGRDHYPRAMFCLLGGGGIKGGQVAGESDARGENPKDKPITPDDVAATFYKSMGIDPAKEYRTPGGRPVMIVRYGNVISQLLA